jgi:hypothetical protein
MSDPSPLAQADPASLNELFLRDPLSLSEQDIDQIVAELRAQRARLAQAQAAGKPRRQATTKAKATLGQKIDIDMLEL